LNAALATVADRAVAVSATFLLNQRHPAKGGPSCFDSANRLRAIQRCRWSQIRNPGPCRGRQKKFENWSCCVRFRLPCWA